MSTPPPDDVYKPQAAGGKPGYPDQPPRTSGKAVASLIFGLLTPFLCGIPGILAMIFGFIGLSEIKSSQGQIKGAGLATGGIVAAAVGFALLLMAVPVLLLLPAINAAREAARRNGCLSNIRQVGLGAAGHESTTMRFPLASDAAAPLAGPEAATPGWGGDDGREAGYSWHVKLLPYVEERILYDEIQQSSQRMSLSAFDPAISAAGQHPAKVQVPSLRCPSYSGDTIAGAIEYAGGIGDAAVGNYAALSGTHLRADGTLEENGVLVSRWSDGEGQFRGAGINEVRDGISMTILACESRERRYASWYDGQAMWVTGLRTDVNEGNFGRDPVHGNLHTVPPSAAALNVGPYRGRGEIYFPAARFAGQEDREWGPSSEHAGGVVLHVFADAHARAISPDIDATVYMRLITRDGGEPVSTHDF